VVVRGLTSSPVHNVDEAKALFEAGMKARAVASTDVHEHSSRSHCIVRVDVRGVLRGKQTSVKDTSEGKKEKSHRKEEEGETTLGRLYLVDLAGSERVNKSGVKGKQLTEAKNINRSLSALGDVIEALDKKRMHVPYRNSTLTRLLQDALSQQSIVAVIVRLWWFFDVFFLRYRIF
jgi:kinesin family protein C2/C3